MTYGIEDQAFLEEVRGQVDRLEVLARFNHKTLGPISPSEFIPIAEKSGLIIQVGKQVLAKVCSFINTNIAIDIATEN